MADYWKSMPRKFCEFCKCWITDNKPSVDFHERGKRHQANVKKKIEDVKKKSLEKAQREEEMDSDIKKMEKAALEAFKKDLANNPELAAQYGVRLKSQKDSKEEEFPTSKTEKSEAADSSPGPEIADESPEDGVWYEAKSAAGYSYYWNTLTSESVWVPPESYVSLAEQEGHQGETTGVSNSGESEEQPLEAIIESDSMDSGSQKEKSEDNSTSITPESIPLPGENIPLPEDIPLPQPNIPLPVPEEEIPLPKRKDPEWARCAYGTWETVKEEPPQVDLQLPTEVNEIPLPDLPPQEPKVKFKEKRVTSLGNNTGESVAFKKRKLGSGARNVRRRDEDD